MPTDTAPAPPNALREQLTATEKRIELVELAALTRKVQLRETTDTDAVSRYAQSYKDGEQLPPIVVFRDGDDLYLADGHHRVAAAKRAQLTELHAIVKKGDRRAATLYAAGANGQHGLPLTNADKRKIVATLLSDDEWKAWSNREIGRVSRTSEALVRLVRKELGAEISEIKRADGTKQKTRNAEAKKPKQQSLLDPLGDEKAMISDTWQRVRQMAGKANLPEIKCRILVALYWYGALPDCPMKRDILAKHIDAPLDVHPGQLAAAGDIARAEYDGPAFCLHEHQRDALRLVLEPAIVPHAPSVPAKPELPARSPDFDPMGPTNDPDDWQHIARRARIAVEASELTIAGYAEKHGLSYAMLAELLATGEAPMHTPAAHKLYDAFPVIAPAAAGPEEITAPVDPKPSPEVPDATPTQVPALRPVGLRRLDKQREILSRRLLAGKLSWSGSDDDLFLLARIAGVPSAPTAWIDAARATARVDFLTALSRECADRVKSGECMNGRKWPQLPELCRLWGLDHQAIEIEAERAVPA
ncbi:MAG: hypothetical protein RLZZ524_1630 [Pseudomonadota bacterium]